MRLVYCGPSPAIFSARKTVPTERDGGDAKNARSELALVDLHVHCEVGIVPQYAFGIASAERPAIPQGGIRTSTKRGRQPRGPTVHMMQLQGFAAPDLVVMIPLS